MVEVASLHIYPIKSGRGVSLERMPLDRIGPVGDRRWMVVDDGGNLVTQREYPRLCLLAALTTPVGLRLAAPGLDGLEIPFPEPKSNRVLVRVWKDQVAAFDGGNRAAQWLSDFLGASVRLVYFPDDGERRTDSNYDPLGGSVGFADGFPILIISQESLDDLNRRLPSPLPMDRFRPNVVVRGAAPFAEDGWKRFWINGVEFNGVKPCARCVMTTTDQATAERAPHEPLRTLATFRKQGGGVMFGSNVVHRGGGSIALGNRLTFDP